VRSAGKSVTTLLVGRAIEETRSFSAETPVISLLPQYRSLMVGSPSKDRITVADVMSMSAGFACDDNDDVSPGNEDTMVSQTQQPDWYAYTLALPILFSPGSRARYCTAEINLLGALISKETGMWLPDYFYDRFALPMQFGEYAMWLMPAPVEDAYMGGGDYFLPRDFLKFGQLFLNHGVWNGTQIINDAWLQESAEKHSYVEDGGGDYGFGWHLSTYNVRGRQLQAISAGGNGGQLLYIFPELDTTIFIAAGNYGQFPVWHRFETELVPRLLASVSQEDETNVQR
jgi:CubicO group peptidase (beta-lactamase class C family)